jgi:hypothetical protein
MTRQSVFLNVNSSWKGAWVDLFEIDAVGITRPAFALGATTRQAGFE